MNELFVKRKLEKELDWIEFAYNLQVMGIGNAKAKFSLDVTNTGHAHLLLFHY